GVRHGVAAAIVGFEDLSRAVARDGRNAFGHLPSTAPLSASIHDSRAGSSARPTAVPGVIWVSDGATTRTRSWSTLPVSSIWDPIGSATLKTNGMPSSRVVSRTSSPRKPTFAAPDTTGAGNLTAPIAALPFAILVETKFIGGEPTKPPTNVLAGRA